MAKILIHNQTPYPYALPKTQTRSILLDHKPIQENNTCTFYGLATPIKSQAEDVKAEIKKYGSFKTRNLLQNIAVKEEFGTLIIPAIQAWEQNKFTGMWQEVRRDYCHRGKSVAGPVSYRTGYPTESYVRYNDQGWETGTFYGQGNDFLSVHLCDDIAKIEFQSSKIRTRHLKDTVVTADMVFSQYHNKGFIVGAEILEKKTCAMAKQASADLNAAFQENSEDVGFCAPYGSFEKIRHIAHAFGFSATPQRTQKEKPTF